MDTPLLNFSTEKGWIFGHDLICQYSMGADIVVNVEILYSHGFRALVHREPQDEAGSDMDSLEVILVAHHEYAEPLFLYFLQK